MKTLTFSDTLRPETADVYLDPNDGTATVWGTVIGEIRKDLPVAVAVEHVRQDDVTPGDKIPPSASNNEGNPKMPLGGGCCYLEGIVGCSMTLISVLATFAIEVAAAICYCLAAGFYSVVKSGGDRRILGKAILMLIVTALMLADAVLLTTSLILTEVLGLTTGLVTSFVNCSRCFVFGEVWHSYIRTVCHLTRWAFRDFHRGWALERRFPSGGLPDDHEREQGQTTLGEPPLVIAFATSSSDGAGGGGDLEKGSHNNGLSSSTSPAR